MNIVKKAHTTDGTEIQIENWHENYEFIPQESTLAAYPIAKTTHPGSYAPKAGEMYRVSFSFPSREMALAAFDNLINGCAELKNYIGYMHDGPKYGDII